MLGRGERHSSGSAALQRPMQELRPSGRWQRDMLSDLESPGPAAARLLRTTPTVCTGRTRGNCPL